MASNEAKIQQSDRVEGDPRTLSTRQLTIGSIVFDMPDDQEAEIQEVDRIEPARVPTHRRQEAEIQEVDRIEPARVPTYRRQEARFEGVDRISVPTHRRQEALLEGGDVFIDVPDDEEAAMELELLRTAASRKRRQEKSLSGSVKAWLSRLSQDQDVLPVDPEGKCQPFGHEPISHGDVAVILAFVGATVLALKAIPKNEGDDGRAVLILLIALGIYVGSLLAYKDLGRHLPLRLRRVFEVIVNAIGIGVISCFFGLYCIILSFISIGIAVVYVLATCFLGFPE